MTKLKTMGQRGTRLVLCGQQGLALGRVLGRHEVWLADVGVHGRDRAEIGTLIW